MLPRIFVALFLVLFTGCTMPHKLAPGFTHQTPTHKSRIVIHELSIIESSWICHELAFRERPFLALLSLGTLPACSLVERDGSGGVQSCEVWVPRGIDWMKEHELRHCMGYRDSLY